MSIANMLKEYLDHHEVSYELLDHRYSTCSMEAASNAQVPPEKIAKCIMLADEGGYVMAVCPASRRIKLGDLYREINRRLVFAKEDELVDVLMDCSPGAVPPIGDAYNIEVVLDEELLDESDVYFEAGNHEELIHVAADAFDTLMRNADRASFTNVI